MTNTQDGLRITRVDSIGDDALDIALSNGNIILLQTTLILALPGFEGLREDDRVLYPKTDGTSLYWRDGPKLSMTDIFTLMGKANQSEEERKA